MNNEPNKPIEAEELTEKELEGVVGGGLARAGLAKMVEVALVRKADRVVLGEDLKDAGDWMVAVH